MKAEFERLGDFSIIIIPYYKCNCILKPIINVDMCRFSTFHLKKISVLVLFNIRKIFHTEAHGCCSV